MAFKDIYAVALRYLAMREHSQKQLQQKLQRKFPEEIELIHEVLTTLSQENYQSDQRFADAYLNMRVQRGYGPVKITYELQERGLNADMIEAAFERAELDWPALQEQVRQKKFGPGPLPKDFTNKAKQLNFLFYRGFSCNFTLDPPFGTAD